MRLLVLVHLVLGVAAISACRPADAISEDPGASVSVPARAWRVAESSAYFDFLSTEIRERVSDNPHALGEGVCRELGGRLESLTYRGDTFGPNAIMCVFEEPGMKELVQVGQVVQP